MNGNSSSSYGAGEVTGMGTFGSARRGVCRELKGNWKLVPGLVVVGDDSLTREISASEVSPFWEVPDGVGLAPLAFERVGIKRVEEFVRRFDDLVDVSAAVYTKETRQYTSRVRADLSN